MRHLRVKENRSRGEVYVELSRTSRECMKREKERKRGKGGKKLPAISTRSWILCSEQNIVRARDDNISGKWVNGVVLYIYIYIFRKFERKLPSISVEIGFEGKRNDPGKICFMGELEKKNHSSLFCSFVYEL